MKDIIIKEVSYDINLPTKRNKTNDKVFALTMFVMVIVFIGVIL